MTARQVSRIVLGLGALVVVYGAVRWWHGERVFARMRATTCTVLSKKLESKLLAGTGRRGWAAKRARYRDEARFVFAHTVDGRQYTFTEHFTEDVAPHVVAGYEKGRAYPCRYDPQDPRHGTVMKVFDSEDAETTLLLGGILIFLGVMTPYLWRTMAAGLAEMRER